MLHRELLTESQRLSLQTPVTDKRGMVRHYTLSSEDLTLINRRRGDPNRLGFALMLCYLRFPGRILQQGEQPPAALCAFVAEQLNLDAAHFGDYAERDQTRREHVRRIAHDMKELVRTRRVMDLSSSANDGDPLLRLRRRLAEPPSRSHEVGRASIKAVKHGRLLLPNASKR